MSDQRWDVRAAGVIHLDENFAREINHFVILRQLQRNIMRRGDTRHLQEDSKVRARTLISVGPVGRRTSTSTSSTEVLIIKRIEKMDDKMNKSWTE